MSTVIIFEVFTLFPEVFSVYLQTSILDRAQQKGYVKVNLYNIRIGQMIATILPMMFRTVGVVG